MGAKSDVIVKLVLVFFISMLSFAIGTFVGKKYSDNQHKLAVLEPKKEIKEERSVASVDGHEKKSETLSDDEIKKLAEEFVADDSEEVNDHKADHETANHQNNNHASTSHETATTDHEPAAHEPAKAHHEEASHAKTTPDQHTASHNPTSPSAHPTEAAHQMLDGKTPAMPTKTQPRHPTSLPKDVAQYAVGKFTVQIASYSTEDEAKKRANELKEKGYSAFYVPAQVKGKSWYRVSVGLFATESEAKEYKKEFSSKSKVENSIIQKITN